MKTLKNILGWMLVCFQIPWNVFMLIETFDEITYCDLDEIFGYGIVWAVIGAFNYIAYRLVRAKESKKKYKIVKVDKEVK